MNKSTNETVHCNRCGRRIKHHRTHSIFGKLGTHCYTQVAALEQHLTKLGMTDHHNNETIFPAEQDQNGNWGPPRRVVEFLNKPRRDQLKFTHEVIINPDDPDGAPLVKITVQFDRNVKRAARVKSSAQVDAERVTRMLRNREHTLKNIAAEKQTKLHTRK